MNEILNQIENAKDELELLIYKYGVHDKRVIDKDNMIDDLMVEYYTSKREILKKGNVIYISFK